MIQIVNLKSKLMDKERYSGNQRVFLFVEYLFSGEDTDENSVDRAPRKESRQLIPFI